MWCRNFRCFCGHTDNLKNKHWLCSTKIQRLAVDWSFSKSLSDSITCAAHRGYRLLFGLTSTLATSVVTLLILPLFSSTRDLKSKIFLARCPITSLVCHYPTITLFFIGTANGLNLYCWSFTWKGQCHKVLGFGMIKRDK